MLTNESYIVRSIQIISKVRFRFTLHTRAYKAATTTSQQFEQGPSKSAKNIIHDII